MKYKDYIKYYGSINTANVSQKDIIMIKARQSGKSFSMSWMQQYAAAHTIELTLEERREEKRKERRKKLNRIYGL